MTLTHSCSKRHSLKTVQLADRLKSNGNDEQFYEVIIRMIPNDDFSILLTNSLCVISALYSFPYVLQRIAVKDKQFIELTPIEVAVDEMQTRVSELEDVVLPPIDVKKLQLRLQGSVAVQVNAGPLAYATAFLEPQRSLQYPSDRVEDLKEVFR